MNNFADILNFTYPNLEIERDFPHKVLRAAQFAPFAALTGYDEAVAETARLTDKKTELCDDAKEELNQKLSYLRDNPESMQEVRVTYFVPDEKKDGGKYVTKTVNIRKIYDYGQEILLWDYTAIPFENILNIEGEMFEKIY